MGCSYFNRRGACSHIFGYIARALNTAKPYNRYLNHPIRLVNQPERYRFYGRTRQSARCTTQTGLPGVWIYTQCRIGVCYYEGVGSFCLRSLRSKSNFSNQGR